MPFGLKNVTSTFQRAMEEILKDVLGVCCEDYIDDIIICSKSEQEHAHHMQTVFGLIKKLRKCFFGVKTMNLVQFFG